MKNEEAIEILTGKADCIFMGYAQGNIGDQIEALSMAIKALHKQIPKELIKEGDGYGDGFMIYDRFYCPSCDNPMEEDEVENYCPKCGQKFGEVKE